MKKIIFVICLIICAQLIDVKCEEIWGDLTSRLSVRRTKVKFGIPFMERSIEITYPDVNTR